MRKDIKQIKLWQFKDEAILKIVVDKEERLYRELSTRQINAISDAVFAALCRGTLRPFHIGLGWVWEAK